MILSYFLAFCCTYEHKNQFSKWRSLSHIRISTSLSHILTKMSKEERFVCVVVILLGFPVRAGGPQRTTVCSFALLTWEARSTAVRIKYVQKNKFQFKPELILIIRYLVCRGGGSEDELRREVAPREAKNRRRRREEQQQGEEGNGSHCWLVAATWSPTFCALLRYCTVFLLNHGGLYSTTCVAFKQELLPSSPR